MVKTQKLCHNSEVVSIKHHYVNLTNRISEISLTLIHTITYLGHAKDFTLDSIKF